jgi:hypothetical protein
MQEKVITTLLEDIPNYGKIGDRIEVTEIDEAGNCKVKNLVNKIKFTVNKNKTKLKWT